MIEINLIKGKALRKKDRDKFKKILKAGVVVATALLAVCAVYYVSLLTQARRFESEVEQLNAEVERLYERYEMDEWESDWQNLYKKIEVLKEIFNQRGSFTYELAAIENLLPEDIHISEIKFKENGNNILVEILIPAEESPSEKMEEYKEALEESDVFPSEVEIFRRAAMQIKGKRIIPFSVEINF